MTFEKEIKLAQQQHLDQHNFLLQNAPENLKVKARNHRDEYSPEQSGHFPQSASSSTKHVESQQRTSIIKGSMNSQDNMRPQASTNRSLSQSESHYGTPVLNLQPKVYHPISNQNQHQQHKHNEQYHHNSHSTPSLRHTPATDLVNNNSNVLSDKHHSSLNILSLREQTHVKVVDEDDDDNNDDTVPLKKKHVMNLVGLANQIPEFGSPSTSSPRMHRPMMIKSPHHYFEIERKARKVVVPPEVCLVISLV